MSHGSVIKKGERLVRTEGAKLKFHGSMADFGTISAPAGTPARMLRSVLPRYPQLISRLRHGEYKVYIGRKKIGLEVDETSLHIMVPAGTTVHFVPVARGSKGRGASLGKTIAGAVLAIGAVATAGALAPAGIPFFGANGALAGGMFGVSYGAVATFGAFTMLGGISGLLGGKTNNSNTGKDASTALSGVSNNMAQGGCIPLVYGRRVRVGSLQASLSYSAQDWGDTSDTPSDNPSDFEDDNTPTNAGEQGSFDDLKGKSGTGSKSGKGGSAGSEAPNNLRSKSIVKIVDIVGQGPGVELVNGAKSIYFNGTPLMASDGTYNFYGVKATWKNGSPDQTPLTGVPSATDAVTVNTKVANGSPVTQTITSETATSASVVINIPALYSTNKKSGVLENGRDVGILVEVRASGNSQWSPVVSDVLKNKKCTSPYQCTYTFDLPEASGQITQWDVRVTRTTPDDTEVGYASDFYFQYLNVISDYLLVYPDVAYCYLEIDSSAFGDSTPTRTYDVTGKEVRVPANYDPVARTYSTSGAGTENGTWDGITWKIAKAVDDPCWCTLDLVNSDDFGMNVSASKLAMLESDLYEASQYACIMVDDYYGGTEPRYSLNVCINSPGDAFKVLGQFTSSFRAMPYWTAGSVAVSTDMPRSPSMIVTNANVLDGDFSYEGTALSGRHNVAYCSYTNNESGTVYTDVEPYEDQQSVAQFGPRIATVDGFGVSSRGLALRLAHWLVDTELHQTQTVTYQCGIDHAAIRPGEIIEIADHWYQGARQGGRVQPGSTAQVIQLDSTIELESGLTYTLKCLDIDGQPMAATIESITTVTPPDGSNAYSVVTLSNPYSSAPVAETLWAMTEPTKYTLPQWRVINIKDKGDNLYEVTALFHDPAKFDRVENNLPFNEKVYSQLPNLLPSPLPAPTNVSAQDYTVGEGTTTIIRTDVGWTSTYDARILGYNVRAVSQDTGATYIYDAKSDTQYEIDGLAAGTWTFGVRAYGKNGTYSPWVDSQPTVIDGKPNAPDSILGLTAIGQTRAVSLTWTASAIRNLLHYEVQRAPVQNSVVGTFSTITLIAATSYIDSQSDLLLPTTTWAYQIRAVDTYGTLGVWSNVVQATTTYLLVDDLGEAIANTAKFAQALYGSIDQPKVVEGDQLPSTAGYPDKSVINFNGVLYQNKGGTWQRMVGVVTLDNDGNLTDDQIGEIDSTKLTTPLTAQQSQQLTDAAKDNSLTDAQKQQIQDAVTAGTATQNILNLLSQVNFNTSSATQDQLNSLNLANIAGQLTDSQLTTISAAKVTGQLVSDQIASLNVTKLAGQITSTQITDGSISTPKLQAGSVVASTIATGTIISSNISAGAITTGLIAAGAVTTDQLAANSVVAGKISAGAVLAQNIAAGAVTTAALAVASPFNIITNSCLDYLGAGTLNYRAAASRSGITASVSAFSDPNWYLAGYGTGAVMASGTLQVGDSIWAECYGNVVTPNQRYWIGASLLSNWNGLAQQIKITWVDGTGANVSEQYSPIINSPSNSRGSTEDCWTQYGFFATAPASACRAWIAIFGILQSSAHPNNVVQLFTKVQLTPVSATVTEAPRWSNGGSTTIDGSSIKTGTLTAGKIIAGTITGNLIAGGTITGANIAGGTITGNLIAAGTITASNIAGGTITGNLIAANTITSNNLTSGSVTTSKLAVGSPVNLIANSCLDYLGADNKGWRIGYQGDTVNAFSSPQYYLVGYGTGALICGRTLNYGDEMYCEYIGLPVTIGQRYFAGAQFVNNWGGLSVSIGIVWADVNGNVLGMTRGPSNVVPATGDPRNEGSWSRMGIFDYPPANAVSAWLRISVYNTNSSAQKGPIQLFTKAQFGIVPPNSTEYPPYVPGTTTTIDGGNIKTGTLNATKIISGSITASQVAAGTLTASQIAGGSIQGYNLAGNTITGDKLTVNCITTANIQAGAVGADQIAAGSIVARNLSGQTLIVAQAQIGNLVVGTSNMQDSSITTYGYAEYGLGGGNFTIYCAQACSAMVSAYGYVDAISDGSVIRSVTIQVVANGSNGVNSMTVNGSRGTGTLAFPVNLSQGNNTIQLTFTYTGTSSNYQGATRIMVLGRYK